MKSRKIRKGDIIVFGSTEEMLTTMEQLSMQGIETDFYYTKWSNTNLIVTSTRGHLFARFKTFISNHITRNNSKDIY